MSGEIDESCKSGSEIEEGLSLQNLSLRGGGRGSSRARGQAVAKAAAKKGSQQSHGVSKKNDFNLKRSCNIPAAALALLSAAKGKMWRWVYYCFFVTIGFRQMNR